MTGDTMIEAVAINLGDPGMEKYRRALILSRINTAMIKIVRELRPKALYYVVSVNWTAETKELTFATMGCEDILKVINITWNGYKMDEGTHEDFDEYNTTSYSDPVGYYLRASSIGLFPNAPGTTKTLGLNYLRKPTILTGVVDEVIDLPEEYHRAVELEATSMLSPDIKWRKLLELELNELRFYTYSTMDSITIIPPQ